MEMTQEWIDQYNKKCAEFLEWYFENGKWLKLESFNSGFIAVLKCNTNKLKFHSDWNWIHIIKDEIRKNPAVNFSVTNNYVFINTVERTKNGGIGHTLGSYQGSSEKEATIQAIDQFINCYNKQKES